MTSMRGWPAATRSICVTWTVLALGLGCTGKQGSTPDCATAVDNALAMSKAELRAAFPNVNMAKVKDASLVRCKEDSWSADALKCMAAANTSADVTRCEERTKTAEQRKKMLDAITAVVGAGDPGTGSGSDSGSAGSGSAGSGSAGSGAAGSAAK